ncbi:hypothetical protein Tsubulata_004387 [Turnera subulata]|uniref:Inner centromere protein ARK-binding domain-containing protein n=1 Tax=Turnera subulata TaxID=218843 RepID=A0A9Q0FCN3_9ROSI|nr:hypothetical protein Tsubulata_004387 [Turnera subulata]
MSTIEKMVVQIFERKRSVIQQVKHRTDLFDEFLASTCLFDGIAPPPSLWSPRIPGLNREEIIPGLPFRYRPQPSNACSGSHGTLEPIVTAQEDRLPDSLGAEFSAVNESNGVRDRLSVSPQFPAKDAQCSTSNGAAEPDDVNAVSSPQDCRNGRRWGDCLDERQSLACFQKSKSVDRDPGLPDGLGAEVDALNKSNGARDNLSVLTQITAGDGECVTVGGVREQDVTAKSPHNYGDASPQNCGGARKSANSPHHMQSLARIQRSKSRQKALQLRNSVKAVKTCQHDRNVEQERDETIVAEMDIDSDRLVQGCLVNFSESNLDGGSLGMEALVSKTSHDMWVKPNQLDFDNAEECCLNETSEPARENKQEDAPLENGSPTLPHSTYILDTVDEQEKAVQLWNSVKAVKTCEHDRKVELERDDTGVAQTDIDSDRLLQECPVAFSGSNLDGGSLGMEALVSKTSHDMLVKPNQLDFDDAEECCLNETSEPARENKQEDAPLENGSPTLPHSTDILDTVDEQEKAVQLRNSVKAVKTCEHDRKAEQESDDTGVARTDTDSDRLLQECPVTFSGSNLDGGSLGTEALVSKTSQDILVKPSQLEFGDAEECSLNETWEPARDNKQEDAPSEKGSPTLPHSSDILDTIYKQEKALHLWNSVKAVKTFQHNRNVEQESDGTVIPETDINSDRLVQECPVTFSGSNLDGGSLSMEALVSKTSCDLLLKPNRLDLGNAEECSLNETSEPAMQNKQEDGPSEKGSPTLPYSSDILDSVDKQEKRNPSTLMPSLEDGEFSCREGMSFNDSSEANLTEFDTVTEENCVIMGHAKLNSAISQNQSTDSYSMGSWPQNTRIKIASTLSALPGLMRKPFQPFHTAHVVDAMQSNVDKIIVEEIDHNRERQMIEGPEVSSPKPLTEETRLERRDSTAETAFTLTSEQLGAPLISSLAKSVIAHGCLFQKAEVSCNTSIVPDARGEETTTEKQVMQQVEDRHDPENEQEDAPSKKRSPTFPHAADILDIVDHQQKQNSSTEMPLQEDFELSCEEKKSGNDSSEALKVCNAVAEEHNIISGKTKLNPEIYQNQYEEDSYFLGSWPRHKRMKMASTLSASSGLMRKPFQPIRTDHVVDPMQVNMNKILVDGIDQNMEHEMIEGTEFPSPKLLSEEVRPSLEAMEISADTAFTLMHEQVRVPSVLSLSNSCFSRGCLLRKAEAADDTNLTFDTRGQHDKAQKQVMEQLRDGFHLEGTELMTCTRKSMQQRQSRSGKDGSWSSCSVGSPHSQCPELKIPDQNVPEFERFVMETSDERSLIAGEAIDLDKFELPNTALERASILERLCKSACFHTPLSDLSTTYALHEELNLYQSLPNGIFDGLEQETVCNVNNAGEYVDINSSSFNLSHSFADGVSDGLELGATLNLNSDSDKQLEEIPNCLNEETDSPYSRSETDCQSYSNTPSAWDIRKPYASPVGMLWDGNHGILSKSGSSEKRVSSIPELPSISEENENPEDIVTVDTFQSGIPSEDLTCSLKTKPLADTTKNSVLQSVCEDQMLDDRFSLASVNTEFSFTGTCKKSIQKPPNPSSNKRKYTSKGKENNVSLGATGIKRTKPTRDERLSKPKFLGKASVPSHLEKEPTRINIVSNVTSFLPLVQQKQAAAVTGKRDVKVKALEAAENAKRLAEKKENERMMRKQAMKLERAKMEEFNQRQLELEKEKKEVERKRKEAEMAAKRRQREQEEKKEKERKRKLIEDARRQQQEQEEKLRADKEEKEIKGRAQDGRGHERKELKYKSGKHEKMEKRKVGNNLPRVPWTELTTTGISAIDNGKTFSPEDFEAVGDNVVCSKDMGNICKASENDNLISNILEDQYEMSPYKSSDDEDEDDDIPNSKFIPSWVSNRGVALAVSSQQGIDPKTIFAPNSFCDVDEETFGYDHIDSRKLDAINYPGCLQLEFEGQRFAKHLFTSWFDMDTIELAVSNRRHGKTLLIWCVLMSAPPQQLQKL